MNVLVVCLAEGARLPLSSAELIGGARSLAAGQGDRVIAAVLGSALADACGDAAALGADVVYAVEDDTLTQFQADSCLQALEGVIRASKPSAVLFAADDSGAELGPRLAARLGTGAVTEVVGLRLSDKEEILFTRPVYGGRLMAEMVVTRHPAVATIMGGALAPLPRRPARAVEIVKVDLPETDSELPIRVLEMQREEGGGIPLDTARIVVSGGWGLGEATNFRYVRDLAEVLGAAVAASRGAVDEGWATPGMQIGQTGKKVAPELYVAVGISGASQHTAGMSRARHVLVINTDPEAPFFKSAEVGAVIDFKKLLPPLTARLKELLGTSPERVRGEAYGSSHS